MFVDSCLIEDLCGGMEAGVSYSVIMATTAGSGTPALVNLLHSLHSYLKKLLRILISGHIPIFKDLITLLYEPHHLRNLMNLQAFS